MKYLEIGGNFKRSSEWDVYNGVRVRGGIVHDMTSLPIPGIEDETYDGVYSEHFLEHLTKTDGINFLKEMYRVMKPGAIIRTVWPSMDFVEQIKRKDPSTFHFVDMYTKHILNPSNPLSRPFYNDHRQEISKMDKFEKVAHRLLHQEGEHKHLWYKDEMIQTLIELGFIDVKEMPYQKSELTQFNNIDKRQAMRPIESTVIEAKKR